MSRALPGLFCAGEMLDWEAPTGGYLLTASLASGAVAGEGVRDWLRDTPVAHSRAPAVGGRRVTARIDPPPCPLARRTGSPH